MLHAARRSLPAFFECSRTKVLSVRLVSQPTNPQAKARRLSKFLTLSKRGEGILIARDALLKSTLVLPGVYDGITPFSPSRPCARQEPCSASVAALSVLTAALRRE